MKSIIIKAAAKVAGKSGAKLIPVVGTVLMVADIAHTGYKIYKSMTACDK